MRIFRITHTHRISALAGVIAAALGVASLSLLNSRIASAQQFPSATVIQRSNGFVAGPYGSTIYQQGGYRMYGQNVYGGMPRRYTGYGNGPYAYGAPVGGVYSPYGYRAAPAYGVRYGGAVPYQGRVYRPIYNPNVQRFYVPYGYRR